MQTPIPQNFTVNETTLPTLIQLAETIPFGFFIYQADEAKKLIYCNSRMAEIFRCDSKEQFLKHVGNSFKGIVHPDDLTSVERNIALQNNGELGRQDYVRYRILRRDGTVGLLDDYGVLAHSEKYGNICCVYVADVSEHNDRDNLQTVVSALAEDYEMIFHIDFISERLDFFQTAPWLNRDNMEAFNKFTYDGKIRFFADKYVYDDDRLYFLKSVQSENIKNSLETGTPLVARFRIRHDGILQWYELKAVHHALHVGKHCAIVGIRNVDNEMVRQNMLARSASRNQQHLMAFHDIIHSGMWSITLDENSAVQSVQWSDEYRRLLGYTDEKDFPNKLESWADKLHPDDRESALSLFYAGAHALSGETIFDTDFRLRNKDGKYYWYHAAGRIEPNEDGTYQYFGIFVDSNAQHENAEYQAIQKQNLEIIEILASEYSSVYYIDLTTDDLTPYSMNAETETEFGQIFNSGISYSEAFRMYVDRLILPEDKEMMLREGSLENIRNRLAHEKTFITRYRSSAGRYNEMKFVKVGGTDDVPLAVALGFSDKDEQLRQEAAMHLYSEIADALSSKYDRISYVNLKDNSYVMFYSRRGDSPRTTQVQGSDFFVDFRREILSSVHPDDITLATNFINKENLIRSISENRTLISEYRVMVGGRSTYFSMQAVRASDADHIIIASENVDDEVRNRQKDLQTLNQNYEIIEILASEYSSVYYIDLNSGNLTPYTMNEETETTFGSVFRSGITYSEAFLLYVEKQITPDDREMVLRAGSVANIRQELSNKKSFVTTYRDMSNRYSEMKFVKVGGEYDAPVAVALGFSDRDEEVRAAKEQENQQSRYNAVVKALSSEYSSIYFADFAENLIMPYIVAPRMMEKFKSYDLRAYSRLHLNSGRNLYIKSATLPSDRQLLANALSTENIHKQLESKIYFTATYRNELGQYCEVKCVRVNEDGPIRQIVVGFANKDAETRARMLEEQERQRNYDIIEILASEYSSVYYIDLTTDELNPYTMNADTESAFGKIFRSGIHYSAAYRMYVDELILSEDKAMMLKAGSIGNIMKELRNKKTFLTTYRNAEGHYSEMKFVKVGNEDGVPTAVALGFADKDDEIRAREEEQQKLQRNIDIIEILASEYTSVYYIDLTTDELDPYTMNEETETEFGSIFRSGIHYSDAFKLYVDTLVYKDDRDTMLKAGSVYNILKELSNKKTFITTYRNAEGHYSEMKFVKVGDEENPQAVALGFADKDEEIRSELKRKEAAERDAAVITGLSDDFGCVVYASYEDYGEIQYRMDPLFEKNIPGWSTINNFYKRLELLVNTIMHPDDRQAFWAASRPDVVHAAIEKDNVYFINFRTLINGEITYYQCKFAKDEQHKDTHVIAGFHNVDAETKREMDALDQAQAASRAKTSFLFNMSHDIRTPMNAIIGFTNMAMKDIDNKPKALESLEKVRISSNMLLSLINDILDMSRIESGKVTLNELEADMTQSYVNIEPVMTDLAKGKNITLRFTIGDLADRFTHADYPRIERVLVNLISNAIKYTPHGGHVQVHLEQDGRVNGDTGLYKFIISDNGIGMSEHFQQHMFEEFAREENTTQSGVQGTGLGLPLAQKLVHLMRGEITCVSRQGRGSTFTVSLPLRLQTPDEMHKSESLAEKTKEIHLEDRLVLLVEDNELNREIGIDILESEGMKVETAVNGKEALNTVLARGKDYYDFILMDIQMPIMDGYQATRAIRKAMPDLCSPIIALSANAFEEDKAKSMEAGMDDHIAKPINVPQLLACLQKHL